MDTIDKKIEQLFSAKDGITAYKIVNLLKHEINNENREKILESFIKYIYYGEIKYLSEFILTDLVELVQSGEIQYGEFFKDCIHINYSNKCDLGIKGYVKTCGEDSYEFLSRMVFDSAVSVKNKIIIIKELAKHSNNTFDRNLPKNISSYKKKYIDYSEFEDWVFYGYERGNGYEEPLRHPSLDNPENERELILSKIDKKLKILRNKKQDLKNPTNYLVVASDYDINKILNIFNIPFYYLEFLKRYSPINADLSNTDFGRVCIYGAHNLIKNQEGYSYNPVLKCRNIEWNKNFLVVADTAKNPFCIDMTLENSPVFFAYHGIGIWNFDIAYDSFYDFLKSFA